MMGMVSWQGIFPNFTQSISCKSSLTQLDMMMEVGYKKHLRTNHAQYDAICRILFNNTKLQRAQKRKRPIGGGDESNSNSNKVPRRGPTPQKAERFLCEEEGGEVREAMTMKLNKKVNECAKTISDGKLLAKLSAGDVVAQELKYPPTCLVALYNRE